MAFKITSQSVGAFPGGGPFTGIPADRLAIVNWQKAGLATVGGIPTTRTQFGSTLTPSGGDDISQINAALASCPANRFIKLSAGTFRSSTPNSYILFANDNTSLVGSGAGVTFLEKTNGGVLYRSATAASGTSPTLFEPDQTSGDGTVAASFTGSISTTNLTVSAISAGVLTLGMQVSDGTTAFGYIVSQTSGTTGGTGVYVMDNSRSVSSRSMFGSADHFPVIVVGGGIFGSLDAHVAQSSLTVDAVKGDMSVTVASATGFAVGQIVILDELSGASWQNCPRDNYAGTIKVWSGDRATYNMHLPVQGGDDCNGSDASFGPFDGSVGTRPGFFTTYSRDDRPTNEMKKITGIVGNVITFDSPVMVGYRTSHTAKLATGYVNTTYMTGLGVEEMTIRGGGGGNALFNCVQMSWIKNVESTLNAGDPGIRFVNAFRCEARHVYSHQNSWPVPTGGGYLMGLDWASSEILIEDCICVDTCKTIVARAAGAGSVVAYSYMDNCWDAYGNPTFDAYWQECALNASHFIGPHHVLFEGNWAPNFDSDFTHGGSNYHTVFRNYLPAVRRNFSWDVDPGPVNTSQGANVRAIGSAAYSWYMSFVGNVLGYNGLASGGHVSQWEYTSAAMACDVNGNNCVGGSTAWGSKGAIWKLGYDPIGFLQPELTTINTAIRDGNWDWLTSSQRWHNTPGTFTIPNSLYKTSAPDIFVAHSNAWPWVDPSNGSTALLPAKVRFEAGTPNGS